MSTYRTFRVELPASLVRRANEATKTDGVTTQTRPNLQKDPATIRFISEALVAAVANKIEFSVNDSRAPRGNTNITLPLFFPASIVEPMDSLATRSGMNCKEYIIEVAQLAVAAREASNQAAALATLSTTMPPIVQRAGGMGLHM